MLDDQEQELLTAGVRAAMTAHTGADLDAALADLGWLDLLDALPDIACEIVFTTQGETNAASTALDDLVLGALGADRHATLVMPAAATATPPGHFGDTLRVDGLASRRIDDASQVLVPALVDGVCTLTSVERGSLSVVQVSGLDPSLGLRRVTATSTAATSRVDLDVDAWTRAVAGAQLALAHELVGCARKMLSIAVDHAVERVQFDRPIASFQAVRHRLAETLVAIEGAAAAVRSAVDFPGSLTAALAKAAAGDAARTAGRSGLQVLAGIGFTTEHHFHPHLRRANVVDTLWGSADHIDAEIGADLIRSRTVERLVDL